MSNLLKSKFLLGVMVVAAFAVTVGVSAPKQAAAASCTITTTLRLGSRGAEVKCLQAALDNGLVGDGVFGPKTKAKVVAWQASVNLVADGVFGAKSRAAWMGGTVATVQFAPAGCTSASGYSSTLGLAGGPCHAVASEGNNGCQAGWLFNPATGLSCTGVVTPQSGPLSVSLASDNPASGYIIANQATADLAHFTFTGTGTLNSVTLQRGGVSDQNTLSSIYLFNGNTRLTDGYSFNNTGQLTMNNLGIAVNGSVTLSVKADVASVTNASSLSVALVGYTVAGGTPVTVSVKGNDMTYGVGNLAGIIINSANQTVGSPSVNAGTSAYTVWSNSVQVNTRAVWLKGANFRMTGSAPAGALGNVHLYVDGISTGAAATMGTITGSSYAMFDFSATPVSLSTGTHTVDLRADIVGGSSYTVTVSLQQASDLVVYDPQVGVNIAATKDNATPTPATYTASTSGVITINPGTASVTIDPTFQSLTNITGGATNTVIARYKVHGYGEDVKVSTLVVKPLVSSGANATSDGHYTQLQNVAVYFNGAQVGSSANYNGSAALSFNLGSQMIIPAGVDSTIEIRADLQNDNSVNYTGGTVSAALNGLTGSAQGQTSHTSVNFPFATGTNTSATTLTIQTGTLAVAKNTGYASQNVSPNTAGVKIGSYTLQNQSTSESVRVTSLAVTLFDYAGAAMSSSSTPALTNFSNLRTSETSGSGATLIQPSQSNTFSVDFTIAPGATKTIDVLADTSAYATSPTNLFNTKLVVTSIGASSNVSISQNGLATPVAGQILTLAVGSLVSSPAPSILSSTTTAAQYVPAGSAGATNITKATFNIASTGGSSTISEMKVAVNAQDVSTAASGNTGAISSTATNITINGLTSTVGFAVGDFIKLSATTPAYGIVRTIAGGTSLTVDITNAGTGAASTVTTVAVIPATVTSVTVGGQTAPVVGGVAYLTGLNLVVPNGGSGLNQDVMVSYAPVGTNGTISGATARIALVYVKYKSGSSTGTLCTQAIIGGGHCVATDGLTNADLAVGGIVAPTMTLVGSSPTFTAVKPASTLSASNIEAIDVTVTANATGNVVLNTLALNWAANNACVGGRTHTTTACDTLAQSASTTNVIVKDSNNQTVTTTNTAFNGADDSAHAVSGTVTVTFGSGYTISGSQTFKIYLPVTAVYGTGVNGASLTTSLATGAAALTWTDAAGNATVAQGATTTLTGSVPTALIPSYPSTFSSIIYN